MISKSLAVCSGICISSDTTTDWQLGWCYWQLCWCYWVSWNRSRVYRCFSNWRKFFFNSSYCCWCCRDRNFLFPSQLRTFRLKCGSSWAKVLGFSPSFFMQWLWTLFCTASVRRPVVFIMDPSRSDMMSKAFWLLVSFYGSPLCERFSLETPEGPESHLTGCWSRRCCWGNGDWWLEWLAVTSDRGSVLYN